MFVGMPAEASQANAKVFDDFPRAISLLNSWIILIYTNKDYRIIRKLSERGSS